MRMGIMPAMKKLPFFFHGLTGRRSPFKGEINAFFTRARDCVNAKCMGSTHDGVLRLRTGHD